MHLRAALSLCILCLAANLACHRRSGPVAGVVTPVPPDNSSLDLKPGGHIRITMPFPGTTRAVGNAPMIIHADHSIEIKVDDVIGYRNVNYVLTGSTDGRVGFRFVSAETSVDGKSTQDATPPPLPFPLPRGRNYTRLVYLIRLSSSDHNMAIVAAKQRPVLEAFTSELKKSPGVCGRRGPVFCVWIPSGVAVRPED